MKMRTLTKADLHQMVEGAGFFASGGGGSVMVAHNIIDDGIPDDTAQVQLTNISEISETARMAWAVNMGAPDALFHTTNPDAPTYAFNTLQEYLKSARVISEDFSYVLAGELGAINVASPLTVAYKRKIPIVDGDPAGRALPELYLQVLLDKVNFSPAAVASQAPTQEQAAKGILDVGNDVEQGQAAVLGLVQTSPFGGIAGLSVYNMTGAELKRYYVRSTLTDALEVGRIMSGEPGSGAVVTDNILCYLNNKASPRYSKLLYHGEVKVIHQTSGGINVGYIGLGPIGEGEVEFWIYNANENLFAFNVQDDHPAAIGPDSICYVTGNGGATDNSDLTHQNQIGLELYVVGVAAVAEMRNSPAVLIKFDQERAKLGYGGKYVYLEELSVPPA